ESRAHQSLFHLAESSPVFPPANSICGQSSSTSFVCARGHQRSGLRVSRPIAEWKRTERWPHCRSAPHRNVSGPSATPRERNERSYRNTCDELSAGLLDAHLETRALAGWCNARDNRL